MDVLAGHLKIVGLVMMTLVAGGAVWRWLWIKIRQVTFENSNPGCVGVMVTWLVGTGVFATLLVASLIV